mgnify:CR=1 FL=1
MALQTFLGPILAGTQKNTNPVAVTSGTPSASFLSATGTGQSYRNTGVSNFYQFITIPQSTLTAISSASTRISRTIRSSSPGSSRNSSRWTASAM